MWMQDRLDDGRRVVDRTLHDGRKAFDRTVHDGRRMLDRTVNDGRKTLDRTVDDGRRVVSSRFDEGRRAVSDRVGQGRRVVDDGVNLSAALWPAVILAAGAGAAVWWWTQYSRNRDAKAATAEGGEGPQIRDPELVMAHNRAPKPNGPEAVDAADAGLVEPAEELMLHAPAEGAPSAQPTGRRTTGTAKPPADAKALAALVAKEDSRRGLDESLGVQGAASGPAPAKPSKRKGPNGATPGVAEPRSKGPTVM